MIENFALATFLAAAFIFLIIAFIDCLITDSGCRHEKFATFDSYHQKMCIDCGQFFSTKEVKK